MADKLPNETGLSRRNVFHILGAVPIAATVAGEASGQDEHTHHAASETEAHGPYKWQVFDPHQAKTVRVLAELIIPADDHSKGAGSTDVPEFMDDWLAFRTREDGIDRLQAEVLGGLMWLDRESRQLYSADFLDASPDQQKQLLDRVAHRSKAAPEDRIWADFFSTFRNLTVSGFFSSKEGVKDLPYLGNTVVVEWKGCDPKVWAVIEERMKNGYQGLINPKA